MPYIISKVEKRLVIPPKMRGIFPNKETLTIDLPAGKAVNVPKYVADYYTKNRPHVYRYANVPEPTKEPIPQATAEIKFDPVEFLEANYSQMEEALQTLTERKNILAVGTKLGLTGIFKQKNERIKERILQDIAVKNRQQEELNKHKGAIQS